MKADNCKRELPEGYKEVLHFNAKDVKVGIIMNLCALLITALVLVPAILVIDEWKVGSIRYGSIWFPLVAVAVFLALYLLYMVLHELTHGISYKLLTGEKLTYGLTLSVAFCGVPNVFVSRRASIISAAMPLIVYSIILGGLTLILFPINTLLYLLFAILFASHLGGCCGDMLLIALLLFKYRDPRTLVRDTGPEQFIYVPKADAEERE